MLLIYVCRSVVSKEISNLAGKTHSYRVVVEWTGNRGHGTANAAGYSRDHTIRAGSKSPIAGSSDSAFRGDSGRWNPEELLLASISACHKLWYLGLCAEAGISVVSYRDEAEASMLEEANGTGRFTGATLRPRIVIQTGGDIVAATRLHRAAHAYCFIANSVNFPIACEPIVTAEPGAGFTPVSPPGEK
jgi:organic hydroperoxide reductase OsmC/OhrA